MYISSVMYRDTYSPERVGPGWPRDMRPTPSARSPRPRRRHNRGPMRERIVLVSPPM